MSNNDHISSPDRVAEFVHTHAALAAIVINLATWAGGLLICWLGSAPMYGTVAFALPISAALGATFFSSRDLRTRLLVIGAAVGSTFAILVGFIWITGYRPGIGIYGTGDGIEPTSVAVLTAGYAGLFVAIQFLCAITNSNSGNR